MNDGELRSMDQTTVFRLKFQAIRAILKAKSYMVMTDHSTVASVHPSAAEGMLDMYDNNSNNLKQLARMHTHHMATSGGGDEDNQGR